MWALNVGQMEMTLQWIYIWMLFLKKEINIVWSYFFYTDIKTKVQIDF